MKTIFLCVLIIPLFSFSQQPTNRNQQLQKIDTANLDLKLLADKISNNETNNFLKAKKILYWLSSNFRWLSTDYNTRTVKEIIARNGGNCFELAKVYVALIKESGIKYRGIAEINIHPYSEQRQATASSKVKQNGNALSVFGLIHNDHRWIEIYDKENDTWQPADPSTGVIGITDWLKARVWFGERKTIDTAISNQMIVPFAVFVTGTDNKPTESRTAHYLIDEFNILYQGKLSSLPEWKEWVASVNTLTTPSMNAFLGKENLHDHQADIKKLAEVYAKLRTSYLSKYND